jgi:uncharacterized membrane protein
LKINLTSRDITAISICAALYAVFGLLTRASGLNFLGVGFLPAVIIPAVFAVLYGPWVGGLSGALGIFIQDMVVHGNPVLSLVAGVPANFVLFFLIGYLYTKNISLKHTIITVTVAIVGLLIASVVLYPDIVAYTGASSSNVLFLLAFVLTIIAIVASLIAIVVLSVRWKEWRSYTIGAVVGQIVGCLLLSVTVWLVSPLFLQVFGESMLAVYILPLFVYLIITELPFILLAIPIIKVIQKIFPTMRYSKNKNSKGGNVVQESS